MMWIIKLTHEDDEGFETTCRQFIRQEMLDRAVVDFRTHVFEQMVKQIEDMLKGKNV